MIYYEFIKSVDNCFALRYLLGKKKYKGVRKMKVSRKLISLILLCSVICSGGCGKIQSEPETTQSLSETVETTELSTQEPVKESLARTVEVEYGEEKAVFEFNDKGLIVSEKNRPYGDSDAHYLYDNENRIVEISYAHYDDADYEVYERVTYEYNADGKLAKTSTYNLPENELTDYCEYEYENGKLIKKVFYEKVQGEIVYTYSEELHYKETEEGTEINFRNVSNDGSVGESTSTYDKNGKLIREDYPGGPGSTEYIYDESGNLIKEIYGYNEQEAVYEYEDGVLVKKIWVKDEFLSEEYNCEGNYTEYKYYDNGNIVAVYWCDKTGATEEINIDAIPEVKGNFAEITEF